MSCSTWQRAVVAVGQGMTAGSFYRAWSVAVSRVRKQVSTCMYMYIYTHIVVVMSFSLVGFTRIITTITTTISASDIRDLSRSRYN